MRERKLRKSALYARTRRLISKEKLKITKDHTLLYRLYCTEIMNPGNMRNASANRIFPGFLFLSHWKHSSANDSRFFQFRFLKHN